MTTRFICINGAYLNTAHIAGFCKDETTGLVNIQLVNGTTIALDISIVDLAEALYQSSFGVNLGAVADTIMDMFPPLDHMHSLAIDEIRDKIVMLMSARHL